MILVYKPITNQSNGKQSKREIHVYTLIHMNDIQDLSFTSWGKHGLFHKWHWGNWLLIWEKEILLHNKNNKFLVT